MIGDFHVDDGEEFVVVWSGGEGLSGRMDSKPSDHWTPPNRIYNKTGKYAKLECDCVKGVDNSGEILDDIERLNTTKKEG